MLFFQSGRSSFETEYTYADSRERDRREAEEKEKRRLENERQGRLIEEKMRIKREKQEEEARERAEEEARRDEEVKKRLQLEAELYRRRDELFNYKFGNKTNNFLGVQIEDVTQLRIGVFGPTGSGKSCFINTCERTVRPTEKGSAPESITGQDGNVTLQDHLPEMFFHLVNTRGFLQLQFLRGS